MKTKQLKQKSLNALMVQNNPKLLTKAANIQECRKLLNDKKSWVGTDDQNANCLDIIAFPEMSFTGYNFEHYEHVLPMACFMNQGQDFQFGRQVANKFNSYVVFGYVQKVLIKESKNNDQFELFNSAAVLDREGKLILNTRKSHLYFCDQLWSKEGDGFKTFQITNKKGQKIKCAVGICMDINQKNFNSGRCQLAQFIIQNQCQCLIFISNWTDNSPQTNQERQLIKMLNYWLYRLDPLLKQDQPQRLFLISDRVGFQFNYYSKAQSWFFGCSGGLNINPPQVYCLLDKRQQKCIFIQGIIPIQPS